MTTTLDQHDDVVRRFAEACRRGDPAGLQGVLDPDAIAVVGVTTADGKVSMLWIVQNPVKLGGWHRPLTGS